MSDRVALVNNGNIVQEGAPRDVYLRPADSFAANFLGRTNLLEGTVTDMAAGTIETRWGVMRCALPAWASQGTDVTIGFRPESVVLAEARDKSQDGLSGKVAAASFTATRSSTRSISVGTWCGPKASRLSCSTKAAT
jgi:ABC-type Fe3+/spermidine/putrescine transport system ATPase subunit